MPQNKARLNRTTVGAVWGESLGFWKGKIAHFGVVGTHTEL